MNTLQLLKLTSDQKINGIWLEEEYDSDSKSWWDNDQICHFSQWKNDKLDGIWKWWGRDGKLRKWELWKDDELVKDYLK